MVSSTGARLLVVVPLAIAIGQLLLSSAPAFVGRPPRFSHNLQQLAPGRCQELQGSKVTAHFFKKLLNRKKNANLAEPAPDIQEPAVSEKAEAEAVGRISTLRAQVAEPIEIVEQTSERVVNLMIDEAVAEPVVNFMIDEAVASPQVMAQEDVVLEPTREASMDDFSFKVMDAEAPVTSLLKKDDDIYDFFVELTDRIESLWNARTAIA